MLINFFGTRNHCYVISSDLAIWIHFRKIHYNSCTTKYSFSNKLTSRLRAKFFFSFYDFLHTRTSKTAVNFQIGRLFLGKIYEI